MSEDTETIKPLRVGILIEGAKAFSNWEIDLFCRLYNNTNIALVCLVVNTAEPAQRSTPALARLLQSFENRFLCPPVQSVQAVLPITIQSTPRILESDLAASDLVPDILLSHVPGPLSDQTRSLGCDVWEYHFNSGGARTADAFGMREVLTKKPTTETAILSRDGPGNVRVIGSIQTNTKFSAAFTAEYAKSMLPSLVENLLKRHAMRGHVRLSTVRSPAPAIQPLSTGELLRYCLTVSIGAGRRAFRSIAKKLGGEPDKWSLLVGHGSILEPSLTQMSEIPQPKNEYRADPFLFERNGTKHVFFESWAARGGTGKIHVGRLDGHEILDIEPIEFGDIHLSYPYVFAHEDDVFMIPETHERRRVEVWKCTQFPTKWELYSTALEGLSPADTSLLQHNDEWWLLTTLSTSQILDHCMELHAFQVDGPELKSVKSHALNPVVLDTVQGRNAGRPFVQSGKLIRPAQSSQHGLYGYDLRLMEITQLAINQYEEREVRRIEPDQAKATTGCHHVDVDGDVIILDARRSYGARLFGARKIALRAV
ncbi:hypothetical protein BPTFM16_01572 [Altererythrobacter insulae]|nr:hypothetical protein BPTFM16_01572 [Altererythrobacter insulae]